MLVSAACGSKDPAGGNETINAGQGEAVETNLTDPATIKPGEPGGLPDDRTPISEGAIDPKSGQGAGQVLQLFGGLLEQRKFAEARKLWSDQGRASGQSEAEFVAAYDRYAEVHSEVGAPGQMEGAAGSSYVDIPFRLYGKLKDGKPFNQVGTVTLKRVNDVPGSTEEQRSWRITKTDLQPRP
jgi:hypothetical protein